MFSDDLNEKFIAFEQKYDLFGKKICGVDWDVIRYHLYFLALSNKTEQNKLKRSFGQRLKRIYLIAYFFMLSLFVKNPFFFRKSSIFFIGHPRRQLIDGFYHDIYTDNLIDDLKVEGFASEVLTLERAESNGLHKTPVITKRLAYLDFLQHLSSVIAFIIPLNFFCKNLSILLSQYASFLDLSFSKKKHITKKISLIIINFYVEKLFFSALFKVKPPRVIFTVVSTGNEPIIIVAKSKSIATYELQHGSPSSDKLNYDFPNQYLKEGFAENFLSFGGHLIMSARLPIPDEKIMKFGFPYLTKQKDKYENVSTRQNGLLVISQPVINDLIVEFVNQLVCLEHSFEFVRVRLHPQQTDFDRVKRSLQNKGIQVDERNFPLYQSLSSTRFVLGGYSTALYEATFFGCKVFVLNKFRGRFVGEAVNAGIFQVIESPRELIREADNYCQNQYPLAHNKELVFYEYSKERLIDIIVSCVK